MRKRQFESLKKLLERLAENNSFYKQKFQTLEVNINAIKSPDDIKTLPFTTKEDLIDAYPLGIQGVPDKKIVRVVQSSYGIGKSIIIPYTSDDVKNWVTMVTRCLSTAGITTLDRIQFPQECCIWTSGLGFQTGVENLGAMAVPIHCGDISTHIQIMVDLKTTVLATSSTHALLIAEEIEKRGLRSKLYLKKGLFVSGCGEEQIRNKIKNVLGIEIYDIYGFTDVYNPGISIDCEYHAGLHYWDDHLYFEVIDPVTRKPVKDGEYGELVITTLSKEGAPLLRYRTGDLTRIIPGRCPCGLPYPRHDGIIGKVE